MDDGIPIGLILLFALCLLLSAYFSATEIAISSVSRIRMRNYAEDGNRRAKRVLSILDHFDNALTTILIGNNIVNIGCATISTIIATNVWGSASVTMATLLTTVLLFVLGETIPKTFAKSINETFAMAVSGSLSFLMRALHPLVFVLGKITGLLSRPFRKAGAQPTVTGDELRDLIGDAVEDGAIAEETGELVQSAFRYANLSVRDVLTPWRDVRKLPADTPHEEVLAIVKGSTNSRLPVIDKTGEAIGLLRIRKYLKATLRGKAPASVAEVMEPIHSISEKTPVDDLLPMMSNSKTHFTLVRDEWENVIGIVTMEDILENLVGDIWDEDDEMAPGSGGAAV